MSYRLWFRLDDVLPLAEHAMACTTHRLTTAQALALAPLRPALTWTGSPMMDVLVSNGTPAWYGERGADHAAEAHTWRHPATNRYGTALVNGYDIAYLPLDMATGESTVIDLLRKARHTDQHWITVDIDPADRHLIAPGRVAAATHRDQHVPADATWVHATVTSTAVAGQEYPALVADGYTTDAGCEVPRFDRATAELMIADLNAVHANPDRNSDPMPGEYPYLQWAGDVLLLIEERDNVNGNTYREVDQAHPDPQGRYAIGAYGWPWQRATADPKPGR